MKAITIITILLFAGFLAGAQDCDKVKYGKFRIVTELDSLKIETKIFREKNIQVEEASNGVKMQFEVKWTSPCSYELSKPKVLKGVVEGVSDDQVLFVKILKVTRSFYTTEITSNFADMKLVKDIEILH